MEWSVVSSTPLTGSALYGLITENKLVRVLDEDEEHFKQKIILRMLRLLWEQMGYRKMGSGILIHDLAIHLRLCQSDVCHITLSINSFGKLYFLCESATTSSVQGQCFFSSFFHSMQLGFQHASHTC